MMSKTSKKKGSPYKKQSKQPAANGNTAKPQSVLAEPAAARPNNDHPAPSAQPSESTGLTEGTLQQQRARFALQRIRELQRQWQNDLDSQKEFNSHASAMPFMIRANGLGQAAAFYRRKGPEHVYYRHYRLLGDWLAQPGRPFAGTTDLLEAITGTDLETYLAAQVEALQFLDWVKKLSSAFLARQDDDAGATAEAKS